MSSTVEIWQLLDDEQRHLICLIWAYFLQNNQWMPVRALRKEFGGITKVRALIKELGGSIVIISEGQDPQQCVLTTLGVLLSDQGEQYERLLADYLRFVYDKCNEEPERDKIKSQEVAEALQFNPDEITALGGLFKIGSRFAGGG